MIVSTSVIGTPTDTDHNSLRSDLLENHKHTGTDGSKIDHGDLLHPGGYNIIHEHDEVDEHIDASSGVHGQPSGVYAAGVVGGKLARVVGHWSNTEDETGTTYLTIYDDKWTTLKVSLSPLSNTNPAFDSGGNPQGSIEMADTDYIVTLTVKEGGKLGYVQVGNRFTKYFEVRLMMTYGTKNAGEVELFWSVDGKVASV